MSRPFVLFLLVVAVPLAYFGVAYGLILRCNVLYDRRARSYAGMVAAYQLCMGLMDYVDVYLNPRQTRSPAASLRRVAIEHTVPAMFVAAAACLSFGLGITSGWLIALAFTLGPLSRQFTSETPHETLMTILGLAVRGYFFFNLVYGPTSRYF